MKHTHSFAVTGKKSQCSDMVWPQPYIIKTTTAGLILHPMGSDAVKERIRPDYILAWFTRRKTCISWQPPVYLFVITASKEGVCDPATPG